MAEQDYLKKCAEEGPNCNCVGRCKYEPTRFYSQVTQEEPPKKFCCGKALTFKSACPCTSAECSLAHEPYWHCYVCGKNKITPRRIGASYEDTGTTPPFAARPYWMCLFGTLNTMCQHPECKPETFPLKSSARPSSEPSAPRQPLLCLNCGKPWVEHFTDAMSGDGASESFCDKDSHARRWKTVPEPSAQLCPKCGTAMVKQAWGMSENVVVRPGRLCPACGTRTECSEPVAQSESEVMPTDTVQRNRRPSKSATSASLNSPGLADADTMKEIIARQIEEGDSCVCEPGSPCQHHAAMVAQSGVRAPDYLKDCAKEWPERDCKGVCKHKPAAVGPWCECTTSQKDSFGCCTKCFKPAAPAVEAQELKEPIPFVPADDEANLTPKEENWLANLPLPELPKERTIHLTNSAVEAQGGNHGNTNPVDIGQPDNSGMAVENNQASVEAQGTGDAPRCPKCKRGTSLVLRDYEDGWRLVCGANCGLIIGPVAATGLEFALADFAKFFTAQPPARVEPDPLNPLLDMQVVENLSAALEKAKAAAPARVEGPQVALGVGKSRCPECGSTVFFIECKHCDFEEKMTSVEAAQFFAAARNKFGECGESAELEQNKAADAPSGQRCKAPPLSNEHSPIQPAAPRVEGESAEQLTHGRSCVALTPGHDDECTCGLRYRIYLQTEQTMSAAWRKRAEQAEREAAHLQTKLTQALADNRLLIGAETKLRRELDAMLIIAGKTIVEQVRAAKAERKLEAAEQETGRLRSALESAKQWIWGEFATSNGISAGNAARDVWEEIEAALAPKPPVSQEVADHNKYGPTRPKPLQKGKDA